MALFEGNFRRCAAMAAGAATAAAGLALAPGLTANAVETAATAVTITPNPASRGEAFEGWGTSLVWFANATGGYPDEIREELYQKVFGENGLNLNIARYNVGGGNASDVADYLNDGSAVEGWWNPVTDPAGGAVQSRLYNPDGSVDPAQANKLAFLDHSGVETVEVVWTAVLGVVGSRPRTVRQSSVHSPCCCGTPPGTWRSCPRLPRYPAPTGG
jgi:hypothetical protein